MPARTKPEDGTVRVAEIFIHPLKSCRGTSVQSARYTPQGLENDRKWAIIDAATLKIITARDFPRMILISTRIEADAALPHGGELVITFPEDSGCEEFAVPLQPTKEILSTWEILPKITLFSESLDGYVCKSISSESTPSETLTKYFGKPVLLMFKGPTPRQVETTPDFPTLDATSVYQDMYPLLVLSQEGMGDIEKIVQERIGEQGIEDVWRDQKVPIRRFRPNIVLSGAGPFAEDSWEEITVGAPNAPKITLVSKCARCLLPNVHPDTGIRDKAVPYKVIMKFRTGLDPLQKMKPCVGCNGVPEAEGIVRVGDVVYVKKMLGV